HWIRLLRSRDNRDVVAATQIRSLFVGVANRRADSGVAVCRHPQKDEVCDAADDGERSRNLCRAPVLRKVRKEEGRLVDTPESRPRGTSVQGDPNSGGEPGRSIPGSRGNRSSMPLVLPFADLGGQTVC